MTMHEALRKTDLLYGNRTQTWDLEKLKELMEREHVSRRIYLLSESRATSLSKALMLEIPKEKDPWIDFNIDNGSISLGWGNANQYLEEENKITGLLLRAAAKISNEYYYQGIYITANPVEESIIVAGENVTTIPKHSWSVPNSTVMADILAFTYKNPGWIHK